LRNLIAKRCGVHLGAIGTKRSGARHVVRLWKTRDFPAIFDVASSFVGESREPRRRRLKSFARNRTTMPIDWIAKICRPPSKTQNAANHRFIRTSTETIKVLCRDSTAQDPSEHDRIFELKPVRPLARVRCRRACCANLES
jgi:hypothetical protein